MAPSRTPAPFVALAVIVASLCLLALLAAGCGPDPDSRPSVLLVVIDTLRASSASVYGSVEGTTPVLDELAREGLLYHHAYSPSSWTLPSHASLLSGVGVARHQVGMPGRLSLAEDFVTLAERFQAAGYQTAAFAENILVSDTFQLLQGFDHRAVTRVIKKNEQLPVDAYLEIDVLQEVRGWLEQRDPTRPFFVFVNLADPHSPYTIRDVNPWVPEGALPAEMKRYAETPDSFLCAAIPSTRDVEILYGLYLGDVAEADRKLGLLLEELRGPPGSRKLLTVVTSDHGELFGDRRLLGHEFNLRARAVHIPLVVHGLEGVAPVTIDTPVTLVDVPVSLLGWTGQNCGADLDGRRLPTAAPADGEHEAPRSLLASYSDTFTRVPEHWKGLVVLGDKDLPRRSCGPDDKVFGAMASIIEYPYKFDWFERYPSELYDLSWDPDERSELSQHQADLVARFTAEIERFSQTARLTDVPEDAEPLASEAIESLQALGYIEGYIE